MLMKNFDEWWFQAENEGGLGISKNFLPRTWVEDSMSSSGIPVSAFSSIATMQIATEAGRIGIRNHRRKAAPGGHRDTAREV